VCFEDPGDARKVVDESKSQGIWFDSKRLNVSLFEPRTERAQNAPGKGSASGNPEIDNFIMQFLQTVSAGGMMGGLPMMNNPPMLPGMPPQPNRSAYPAKLPQQRMPRTDPNMRGDMYAQRPPMQNPGMGAYPGNFNTMMGAPSMGMMQPGYKGDFPQKMMPPTSMVSGMMPATPMPPITAVSEDAVYARTYSELLNSLEYQSSSDDDKRNKLGDLMYQYVERKAGTENAPKITGMIIDLELSDLEASTATLQSLNEKITEGLQLLEEES